MSRDSQAVKLAQYASALLILLTSLYVLLFFTNFLSALVVSDRTIFLVVYAIDFLFMSGLFYGYGVVGTENTNAVVSSSAFICAAICLIEAFASLSFIYVHTLPVLASLSVLCLDVARGCAIAAVGVGMIRSRAPFPTLGLWIGLTAIVYGGLFAIGSHAAVIAALPFLLLSFLLFKTAS
jgi:hypothetical protein